MTAISEFRTGKAIRFNNDVWIITEFQHVTPGNWRAMVRTKLKNAKTGRVIENTFRMTDEIEEVYLEEKQMQYLYESDGNLYFMDTETYDQTFIPADLLGDQLKFLKEGDMVKILFNEGVAITAELPNFIEFKVIQADPGVKGDSATNILKYCTIETGAKVQVPLFVKEGDTIKIDTRTGKYLERVAVGR
ncbi:MAG: elongation factor P [candidate division KSB1 bacterium]|nr:elongation factor P [candidate division KSB1 bacterium]MDZ7402095.1 elongation factor P [candidate division KSB1 bacterium]